MSQDEPTEVIVEPTTVALLRETVSMERLRDFYDRAFGTVIRVLRDQSLPPTGPAIGVYFSIPGESVDLGAGFPTSAEVSPSDGVSPTSLPGGRAIQLTHRGAYDRLPESYARLQAWVHDGDHVMGDLMWETYVTEPSPGDDPEAMITLITWPFAG